MCENTALSVSLCKYALSFDKGLYFKCQAVVSFIEAGTTLMINIDIALKDVCVLK